jgi:hypothetical protein
MFDLISDNSDNLECLRHTLSAAPDKLSIPFGLVWVGY